MNWKWQYIDCNGTGMGWFTDADKEALDATDKQPHSWRELSTNEVNSFKASLNQMAYEQS